MDPITIITLVSICLPLLIELIKMIEQEIQKAKDNGTIDAALATGQAKKDQVVSLFSQTWATMQTMSPNVKALQMPLDKVIPLVGQLIDQLVSMFNMLGIFKKTPTPPKPA